MKTLKNQVEWILKEYPNTRNSDITLMIKLWKEFYPKLVINNKVHLGNLYELPREDNIKRIRAKLNAEGKYLPTKWEIAKKRGLKEDEWRNILGYAPKFETKIRREMRVREGQNKLL